MGCRLPVYCIISKAIQIEEGYYLLVGSIAAIGIGGSRDDSVHARET